MLYRGEYDKRREEVSAATPAFLPPMPADYPHNRLGLARWLLRPEHPLTARVAVNRFWQEFFGVGLVKTAEDFGVNGEVPADQELLDWLAVDFRESGWNIKRMFRMMVLSADLPPIGRGHARKNRARSAEPPDLARPALPHGRRDGPRLRPGRQRTADRQNRRAEREALSARRRLGSCGHARKQHAVLQDGQRRQALSAEPVHVLEARRPAGLDGYLQCPDAGIVYRPPRADQYAAAGPGDAQRPAIRRGCPALGGNRA